jgi:sensor histidine kinase regulating citrate/malate metabolism
MVFHLKMKAIKFYERLKTDIILKDFIERNGGKIWLKSNMNQGASFNFSLPIAEQKLA